MNENPRPTRMTPEERKILLSLASGDERALPILFVLCGIPDKRKGEVFRYMLQKGIVGNNLVEAYEKVGKSHFRLFYSVMKRMDGLMFKLPRKKDWTN